VLVTTTSTHLLVTSRDVIGDIVEHSTSYEFNSLTYLLWLLLYIFHDGLKASLELAIFSYMK
jgi:hypothetical protein